MIKDVPAGWRVKKLSECGKIITGKTPSKNIEEYWNSDDISFIKPDDFTKDSIIEFDKGKDFVSYKGFEKNPIIPPYSVLTTCIGNIGKVLINKNKATTNQQINTIVPNKDIHYKFLAYSILKIKPIMLQRANAPIVPMINKTDFGRYEIPIPPLPQQKKIVKVLDTSSGLIEKQKELIENYDLFLKSKFIEMFGDPIQNPMGWEVKKLGNLGKWQSGGTPLRSNTSFYNGNIDWYSSGELNSLYTVSSTEKITEEALNKSSAKLFKKNTLLVGMYDTAAFKMSILKNVASTNQAIANLDNDLDKTNVLWLYFVFLLNKEVYLNSRAGVRQQNLSLTKIKALKTILPPIDLQNKFASIVEKIETIKTKETQKLEHLETLHSSLMDKAFKGEIK